MNGKKLLFVLMIFLVVVNRVYAYKVEINAEVHQYITNESSSTWKSIPYEIKQHLRNSISADPNGEVSFESLSNCNAQYSIGVIKEKRLGVGYGL